MPRGSLLAMTVKSTLTEYHRIMMLLLKTFILLLLLELHGL